MAKKQPAKKKPAPRRRAGRPKATEPVLGPEQLELIADKIAIGWKETRIAAYLGVHPSSVRHHVERNIQPALRSNYLRGAEYTLLRLDAMYRECWDRYYDEAPAEVREELEAGKRGGKPRVVAITQLYKRHQSAWLKLALQVELERCRILGIHRPDAQSPILRETSDDEFRVAGASGTEVIMQAYERIKRLAQERLDYERSLRALGVSLGPVVEESK